MKRKVFSGIVVTLLLIGMLTFASNIQPAKSEPNTTVYLVPSGIALNTSEVSLGYRFNVAVWVSNVTDLYGWQVALYYNASVINMTSNFMRGYFDSWGYGLDWQTLENFTGTTELTVFEFEIIASPLKDQSLTSPLIISPQNVPSGGVHETILGNSTAGEIPFAATDGYFEYSWSPPVHNIDTGLGYATIQEAIDAPQTLGEHTIFVEAGTYYEHVVVNKSLTLIGENKYNTIIDGSGTGNVVNVTANNVNIDGFTVRNSGSNLTDRGVHVSSSSNNISRNIITSNRFGIYLYFSSNNTLVDNDVSNNNEGIHLTYSHNNTLAGNTVSNNTLDDQVSPGIILMYSDNNNVAGNIVNNNGIAGGYNGIGIWLLNYNDNNIITDNTLSSNSLNGIHLDYRSKDNTVSGNNVSNSYRGIYLFQETDSNTVVGNTISNNTIGIDLWGCYSNVIYHNNFIDNTDQVQVEGGYANTWNDGYPSGGNYWSDYVDIDTYGGPYQNLTGGDGVWDTPYVIDENNQDNYPLVSPYWYWSNPITGDINKDMVVDIDDVMVPALAFGSYPGHPKWNPIADLTGDELVDIDDVMIPALHFGETV